jgi:hypothetical protein
MSYNMKELPNYINTAGKITVITALSGVVVFAVVFLLNIGANELKHAEAQDGVATTSVTVLNTPPQWTVDAQELVQSSTSTPTNSGSQVQWTARATDSNNESYYLLICSNGNVPTANAAAVPTCGAGAQRWAVSAFTASGATSTAATTTTEVAPFAEQNDWYAWVCDAVATNPRCNAASKQGTGATASPFNVNKRPSFTVFSDNSPALPGATVTFTTTASDPDVVPTNDTVKLFVCSTNAFNTSTDSCTATTLFSTTTLSASNPSGTYVIPIPMQDTTYAAYGFVVDNHGHEASGGAQGTDSILTVANAAPTVSAAQIVLNGGSNLVLTQEASTTPGFTLQFVATDNNSCDAISAPADDEISGYTLSVFRSGIGSSTCNGEAGDYNANNCYPSGVATTTWNLSCTADAASCTDNTDTTITYNCTFPLWYIADPTDGADGTDTIYFAQDWRAGVSAVDDDAATSSFVMSSTPFIEVQSFLSVALDTFAIPYGLLEPGQQTDPLSAATTLQATGNVGVDELLTGHSMCTYYTSAVTCNNSATSTIAESNQVFATSTVSYATATSSGNTLSSTTQKLLDLNVPKSTSTTPASKDTYWGIRVPISITLAGAYTGENTFYGALSDPSQW